MFSVEKLIKDNKPNLSDKSVRQYVRDAKMILTSDSEESLKQELENHDKIISMVREMYKNPNTRRGKILVCIVLSKILLGESSEAYKAYTVAKNEEQESYEKAVSTEVSDKYTQNIVSDEEFKEVMEKYVKKAMPLLKEKRLSKEERLTLVNAILLVAYYHNAFRIDLTPMKIMNSETFPEDDCNYIIKKKRKTYYVFNVYKTRKAHEQVVIPMTTYESKFFNKVLAFKEKQGTPILVPKIKEDEGFMTENNLSQAFKDIFLNELGKAFTITMNRKRFATNSEDMKEFKEAKDKVDELAKKMMTSPGMLANIYDQNGKADKKEEKEEKEEEVKPKRGRKKKSE